MFAYTLSRMKDNVSDITAAVNAENTFQNLYCKECDWSISPQDITHVFRWTMRYDVPLGAGHRFLNGGVLGQVFGGWGVAGFATWDTGTPVRLTSPNDSSSFGGGAQHAAESDRPVAGGRRPELSDGGLYFNPAAFSRTPPFTFGSAPRTIGEIRNPGGRNLDLLLEKTIATPAGHEHFDQARGVQRAELCPVRRHRHERDERDLWTDLPDADQHAATAAARRPGVVLNTTRQQTSRGPAHESGDVHEATRFHPAVVVVIDGPS